MSATLTLRDRLDDRMSVALLVALVVHAALLLGLSFRLEFNPVQRAAETLDVVLVNFRTEAEPEEAEFLAPVSQEGGGEFEEVEKPAAELSPEVPTLTEGDMPVSSSEVLPRPEESRREIVTTETDDAALSTEITAVEQPETEALSAADLMQQSMQVAQLQPQADRQETWKSKLPRRRFISANTKQYEYATYMAAWVAKVERVGNLNYPLELKRRGVAGDLLMTVGIRADGSVESINVQRASGIPELDEAATRIVRLAAPYAPLPPEIARDVDVLHITRTWRFSNGNRFE
ncbi:MAG: TonB family protein [Xanthomonadales bacterium]|nr:TonB family protein [Xanthomonadales bacterium]